MAYSCAAIIFDFGGVLTKPGGFSEFSSWCASKYQRDSSPLYQLIITNWLLVRAGNIPPELFWSRGAQYLQIEPMMFKSEFSQFFAVEPNAIAFVRSLKGRFLLGLVTNHIKDRFEEIIMEYKLTTIFDIILTSYELKIAKPDTRLFDEILQRLNLKPNECIYIDDQTTNIHVAHQYGMHSILFKSLSQLDYELKQYQPST